MGNTRYMSVPMRSIVHVLVLYIETKVLLMYVAMCEKLSNPQCGGCNISHRMCVLVQVKNRGKYSLLEA